ncbi:MAG: hypothetical protein V9E93_04275 [Steroidobacteraceae bacterium]|nr:hypothetical protein [Pseudomonadota bacterium]
MRSDSWRRAHAQFALGLVLLVPLAADAADREFLRLAQAQERDTRFEDCALVCQKQIDRRIAYCTGLKEALNPADTSAPPPKCKQAAAAEYQNCMSSCPAPRSSLGG